MTIKIKKTKFKKMFDIFLDFDEDKNFEGFCFSSGYLTIYSTVSLRSFYEISELKFKFKGFRKCVGYGVETGAC